MRYKNYKFRDNCKSVVSTQYLTHSLHSYTAKFIPHIPRFFIDKYSKEGDIILDPFVGSGTTMLESLIAGRNSIGIDINPLARLISKVKTTPINPDKLDKSIEKINFLLNKKLKLTYDVDFPNKEYWFSEKSIQELRKIMSAIELLKINGEIDKETLDFFRMCFSSIIRKSSYADPDNPKTYCSPRMQKMRKENYIFTPVDYFKKSVEKNSKSIKDLHYFLKGKRKRITEFVKTNDATSIKLPPSIKELDLIITSPPYANAQEYFRNIKLELLWLKEANNKEIINLDKQQIGGENHAAAHYKDLHSIGLNKIDKTIKNIYKINRKSSYIVYKYFYNMEKNLGECHRVLKKGGHYVIIVGNNTVRGISIPIHETLIALANRNGFELNEVGYDMIAYRKFMTARNNNAKVIDKDWVIDLVKK